MCNIQKINCTVRLVITSSVQQKAIQFNKCFPGTEDEVDEQIYPFL